MSDTTRKMWFSKEITLGNALTVAAVALAAAVWYANTTAHVSDVQIHQTVEQKEAAFDKRFDLRIEPFRVGLYSRLDSIDDKLDKIDKRLERLEERR